MKLRQSKKIIRKVLRKAQELQSFMWHPSNGEAMDIAWRMYSGTTKYRATGRFMHNKSCGEVTA